MRIYRGPHNTLAVAVALLCAFVMFAPSGYGNSKVLGRVNFVTTSKDERNSGVWADGQYVGYIAELKGNKELLLVPGDHEISVRQAGFTDFIQKVTIEPGKAVKVYVVMKRTTTAESSKDASQIKILVSPDRAAVFLDGVFAGHAHEFGGRWGSMSVAAGKHTIRVALPGYQDFVTEIELAPKQKYTLKTKLIHGSVKQEGTVLRNEN